MLQPLGFCQRTVQTSIGQMVYYTNEAEPWIAASASQLSTLETLVFIHGFGGGSSAYEWSQVYPALAMDYHIIAPDLIGWGRSEHPARPVVVGDYLTSLREFLQNTCDGPVTLVASSLSAAMVVKLAIANPKLVKTLFLVAPSGLSDFGVDYRRSVVAQLVSTPIIDRVLYNIAIANANGIRNFLEQRQFAKANRVSGELVEAYLQSAQQPNAEYAALSFVRGDLCFDLAAEIPSLSHPTCLLWGEEAQFTKVDIGRRLAALNPEAIRALHILPNTGLTPHLETPAIAIALLRRWLTQMA